MRYLAFLMAAMLAAAPAWAAVPTTKIPGSWAECARAVGAAEGAAGIPDGLLTAISLAESGRYSKHHKARLAWPWTVMAEGSGQYFPTKARAMAHVRALQARGVRNIDVGCMQVNLKYHPDAFASLGDAFDPDTNAAYAARFLSDLRLETGSWPAAAGRYHSATPEHNRPYRAQVVKLWREQKGRPAQLAAAAPAPVAARPTMVRARPVMRGRSLAAAHAIGRARGLLGVRSAATGATRNAAAKDRFAERRRQQLAAWRSSIRRATTAGVLN